MRMRDRRRNFVIRNGTPVLGTVAETVVYKGTETVVFIAGIGG